MEEDIDIKWLEEYAEQEKKYKLGKEIKKLIKRNKTLEDTNKKLYELGQQRAIQELINNDYISKDKIIKLLNKYDKVSFIAKVDLQELLEGDK